MERNVHIEMPVRKYGLELRFVEEHDAAFIVHLRTDETLSRHMSYTSPDIDQQVNWIREYKKREANGQEFYFMAVDEQTKERLGTTRLYNFSAEEFEVGSWLFAQNPESGGKAILADILTRRFAFELGYEQCKFEVRKLNKSVLRYHSGFKPQLVGEDDQCFYYRLTKEKFESYSEKLLKILGYGNK